MEKSLQTKESLKVRRSERSPGVENTNDQVLIGFHSEMFFDREKRTSVRFSWWKNSRRRRIPISLFLRFPTGTPPREENWQDPVWRHLQGWHVTASPRATPLVAKKLECQRYDVGKNTQDSYCYFVILNKYIQRKVFQQSSRKRLPQYFTTCVHKATKPWSHFLFWVKICL